MTSSKPGRNDPCSCGSGKKYKQCCQLREGVAPVSVPSAASQQALAVGIQHHQAGRLSEAAAVYRQLLAANPNHPDALHLLGLIAHASGHSEKAVELIGKAISNRPAAAFYANLGNVLRESGNKEAAVEQYRKALALMPSDPGLYINLGNTYNMLGRQEQALECFRKVISLQPASPDAHNNLGCLLQVQGKLVEAQASFERVLTLRPNYAEAHNNLGICLAAQGNVAAATERFRQAIALKPDYPEAYYKLGETQFANGSLVAAADSLNRAVTLKPDFADAHSKLGEVFQARNMVEQAANCYRNALRLRPDSARLHSRLARMLVSVGRLEEARQSYARSFELEPNPAVRVGSELMLPPVMRSRQGILEDRARFEHNLDRLIKDGVKLDDPYREIHTNTFFLANHGLNDRPLLQKLAAFYEQACPSLLYQAPHCGRGSRKPGKLKLGFLSKFIYAHSVSLCFSRIIEELAREPDFEVTLISTSDPKGENGSAYKDFTGSHVQIPNDLGPARDNIAGLELDILVYLDIGMEPLSYFLAFARLAPAQCVLGGHPETSGVRNLDYFLCSDMIEGEGAQDHYSEKLALLPSVAFYFEHPAMPASFKSRSQLGLPEDRHVYLCPMMLQKIHPEFDEAVARILQKDPQGVVVFFEDRNVSAMKELVAARFDQTIPKEVRDRVLFLPWIRDYGDFISVNAAADVVLDPFHFGMGATGIAIFSVGTPIVTRPSAFMRGRVGLFYSRLLEITEQCVAHDTGEFVDRAVDIASNPALRNGIKSRILENKHHLFGNLQPARDVARWFLELGREMIPTQG